MRSPGVPAIPGYEVVKVLDGASSTVFFAQADSDHPVDDHGSAASDLVVIKLLDKAKEPVLPKRFPRSRRMLGQMCQSDVGFVPLLDSGITRSGDQYIVSPYYPVGSLQDQLDQGPMPWRLAAELIAKVADIIGNAHAESIVLGDLRPSNIFLAEVGTPVVAAIGMATRRFDDGQPNFFAPESEDPKPQLTPASDVYSLALVFGSLVAGRGRRRDEPTEEFLEELRPLLPTRFYEVIEHGLAESPTNRYRNARTMERGIRIAIDADPDELPAIIAASSSAEPFDFDEIFQSPADPATSEDEDDEDTTETELNSLPGLEDIQFAPSSDGLTKGQDLSLPAGLEDLILVGPRGDDGADETSDPIDDIAWLGPLDQAHSSTDGNGNGNGNGNGTMAPADPASTSGEYETESELEQAQSDPAEQDEPELIDLTDLDDTGEFDIDLDESAESPPTPPDDFVSAEADLSEADLDDDSGETGSDGLLLPDSGSSDTGLEESELSSTSSRTLVLTEDRLEPDDDFDDDDVADDVDDDVVDDDDAEIAPHNRDQPDIDDSDIEEPDIDDSDIEEPDIDDSDILQAATATLDLPVDRDEIEQYIAAATATGHALTSAETADPELDNPELESPDEEPIDSPKPVVIVGSGDDFDDDTTTIDITDLEDQTSVLSLDDLESEVDLDGEPFVDLDGEPFVDLDGDVTSVLSLDELYDASFDSESVDGAGDQTAVLSFDEIDELAEGFDPTQTIDLEGPHELQIEEATDQDATAILDLDELEREALKAKQAEEDLDDQPLDIDVPAPPSLPSSGSKSSQPVAAFDDDPTDIFDGTHYPQHQDDDRQERPDEPPVPVAAAAQAPVLASLDQPIAAGDEIPFTGMVRGRSHYEPQSWWERTRLSAELAWFRSRRSIASVAAVLGVAAMSAVAIYFVASEVRSTEVEAEGVPQFPTTATSSRSYVPTDAPYVTDPPQTHTTVTTPAPRRVATTAQPTTTTPPTTPSTSRATSAPSTIEVLPPTKPPATTPPTTPQTTAAPTTAAPTTTARVTTTQPDPTTTRRRRPTTAPPTTAPPTTAAPTTAAPTTAPPLTLPPELTIPPPNELAPPPAADNVVAIQSVQANSAPPALLSFDVINVARRSASIFYSSDQCVATRFVLTGSDGSVQQGASSPFDPNANCSNAWDLNFRGSSGLQPDTDYVLSVAVTGRESGLTTRAKRSFSTRS